MLFLASMLTFAVPCERYLRYLHRYVHEVQGRHVFLSRFVQRKYVVNDEAEMEEFVTKESYTYDERKRCYIFVIYLGCLVKQYDIYALLSLATINSITTTCSKLYGNC